MFLFTFYYHVSPTVEQSLLMCHGGCCVCRCGGNLRGVIAVVGKKVVVVLLTPTLGGSKEGGRCLVDTCLRSFQQGGQCHRPSLRSEKGGRCLVDTYLWGPECGGPNVNVGSRRWRGWLSLLMNACTPLFPLSLVFGFGAYCTNHILCFLPR